MGKRIVRYAVLLIGMLGVCACEEAHRRGVGFQLEGRAKGVAPLLRIGDSSYQLMPDSLGFVTFQPAKGGQPEEGVFEYGNYRLLLYLHPEKYTEVYINLNPSALGAEFRGEGKVENEILNGKYQPSRSDIDFSLEEKAFISLLEMKIRTYGQFLDSLSLDSDFTDRMKKKWKYRLFSFLGDYPKLHAGVTGDKEYRPSVFYRGYVRKLMLEEGILLSFREYREALSGWIKVCSRTDLQKGNAFECLQSVLQFTDTTFTDPDIREFIIDDCVVKYVEEEGIDSLGKIGTVYRDNVKDTGRVKRFLHLCGEWRKIRPGEVAAPFKGYTRDSSVIRLPDVKGRYIYLLFWKTDCAASCQEVKRLRDLNLRFKKKKVMFAAVSCDWDREQWEKFIVREQMGGVQWYAENADSELEYYRIRKLPHAVLIDPEGKIADASIALPSEGSLGEELQKAGI